MDRREILERLLSGPKALEAVRPVLLSLPYDCDEHLVTLKREHICAALEQFIAGAVSATQLEDWADLLELRPGVEYELDPGDDEDVELVANVLSELSTPDVHQPLSLVRARELIESLSRSP